MIHDCGKCVLQHFNPCGNPDHASMFRVAVIHYLGTDSGDDIYAGYMGDPQAALWSRWSIAPAAATAEELVSAC